MSATPEQMSAARIETSAPMAPSTGPPATWPMAFAWLLIAVLWRDANLRGWWALLPACIFALAPPSVATQLMAAQGWIIFEPNYRGSDNLGNAIQAAIWNDAGAGPGRDVMETIVTHRRDSSIAVNSRDGCPSAGSRPSHGGDLLSSLVSFRSQWRHSTSARADRRTSGR